MLFWELRPAAGERFGGTVQDEAIGGAEYICDVRGITGIRWILWIRALMSLRYYMISLMLGTVGLAYGSVPLYKMVCIVVSFLQLLLEYG